MDRRFGPGSHPLEANVVMCLSEEIYHALHCGFAHLDMKVAELNDGESVEGLRQVRRPNAIVPYVDLCRVDNTSPDRGPSPIGARGSGHARQRDIP